MTGAMKAGSRLLIFEGIMGSGKSTCTRRFAQQLAESGLRVASYTEAADPHPVRASDDLPDFFKPWLHASPTELASRARDKWALYVEARRADDVFTVMDGQLFHGDLSHLFMMEMSNADIAAHTERLMRIIAPLDPMVVYLRLANVADAIRAVCKDRGGQWESYQTAWKLDSPYARRRGLTGLDGLIAMYGAYSESTDGLFAALECSRLAIDTSGGEWYAYEDQVIDGLQQLGVRV